MSRSRRSLWVGAALATLAGCATGQHSAAAPVSPSPSASPSSAASASTTPVYLTGLRSPCPVLKSAVARTFTGSRTAHVFPAPKNKVAERTDCTWDSPKPPWLTMAITVFQGQGIAQDAAERFFTTSVEYDVGRAETFASKDVQAAVRMTPFGPTYFISDASDGKATVDGFSQTTRMGNVVVHLTIAEKRIAGENGKQRAGAMMAEPAGPTETIMAGRARRR